MSKQPPRGVLSPAEIAPKVVEWGEDEDKEITEGQALEAIERAHARMLEDERTANAVAIWSDPNRYGFFLTRFIREDLGLKP